MSCTNKQIAFVDANLTCWNSTEAARRAGYSKKTARSIGAENLTKPGIMAEISTRLAALGMSSAEMLACLTYQARAAPAHFFQVNPDGSVDFDFSTREAVDHLHPVALITRL